MLDTSYQVIPHDLCPGGVLVDDDPLKDVKTDNNEGFYKYKRITMSRTAKIQANLAYRQRHMNTVSTVDDVAHLFPTADIISKGRGS